jgi:hypothetical protein
MSEVVAAALEAYLPAAGNMLAEPKPARKRNL